MYEVGCLKKYRIDDDGNLEILVSLGNSKIINEIISNNAYDVGLWFDDNRHITSLQRKLIYATLKDISEHTGYTKSETKEVFKYAFIVDMEKDHFSLSNCSIQLANEFIDYLLDYVISNGVILGDNCVERTLEINRVLYTCIKYRKCCVCGLNGERHHCTGSRIGMGNDRRKTSDKGRKLICLCRKHHTEIHMNDEEEFFKKYKVYGIVTNEFEEDEETIIDLNEYSIN